MNDDIEVWDAARRLVSELPGIAGNGYELRMIRDPLYGSLLMANSPDARPPDVAFRLRIGPVPDGRVAMTVPTEDRVFGNVRVMDTTISDSIPDTPGSVRQVALMRAIAHEVGHALAELRQAERSFAQRLFGWAGVGKSDVDRTFDPHQRGMLAELQVELRNLPAQEPITGLAAQRIGHILDRLRAAHRSAPLRLYLESAGLGRHTALVDSLAGETQANYRAQQRSHRRSEAIRQAVADAHDDLAVVLDGLRVANWNSQLGTFDLMAGPVRGSEVRHVDLTRLPELRGRDLPDGNLISWLHDSSSVGLRLRAEAAARIAEVLARRYGAELGQLWEGDARLATARVLARIHARLPAELSQEFQRVLARQLARLGAEQLLAMRDTPLPPDLVDGLPRRLVDRLLMELRPTPGTGPAILAAQVRWMPDGGVEVASHRGHRTVLPAEVADRVGRFAYGGDLDRARAALARALGERTDPTLFQDPAASQAALQLAQWEQDLARRQQPGLLGGDHRLVYQDDLLFVVRPGGKAVAAFRFVAGDAPGTVATADDVAFVDPAGGPTAKRQGGVPVFESTIAPAAEVVPGADSALAARRAVVQQVAAAVLRRRGAQQAGLLAELRLELAQLAGRPGLLRSHGPHAQRIGQLLDQLGQADQPVDQVLARLRSHGLGEDVASLLRTVGSRATRLRREAARAVVADIVANLASVDTEVGIGLHLHEVFDRVVVTSAAGPATEARMLPVEDVITSLATPGALGGPVWAQALASLADRLAEVVPAAHAGEVRRRLAEQLLARVGAERLLAGLNAEQLLALRDHLPVPDQRLAEALVAGVLPVLAGDQPGEFGQRVTRTPAGQIELAGPGGRVRQVPSRVVEAVVDQTRSALAAGVELPQVRAGLVRDLGVRLAPYTGSRTPLPADAVALAALGRQWVEPGTGAELRHAVEGIARDILDHYPRQRDDVARLPAPARRLAEHVLAIPAAGSHGALRPARYAAVAERFSRDVAAIAARPPQSRPAELADLASTGRRLAVLLGEAAEALARRVGAHDRSAVAAQSRAQKRRDAAERAAAQRDQFARDRAENQAVAARREQAVAARHQRIAAAYRRAGDRAAAARQAYQDATAELAGLADAPPVGRDWPARLDVAAERAARSWREYQDFQNQVGSTQPVNMAAAKPISQLPHLRALTETVNRLASRGEEIGEKDLADQLLSEWSFAASREGVPITIGDSVRARVRFRPDDPVELLDQPQRVSGMVTIRVPHFPGYKRELGGAVRRLWRLPFAVPVGRILNWIGYLVPDDLAMLQFAVLNAEAEFNRRWWTRSTAFDYALPAMAAENRGQSTIYDVSGVWEVQVLTSDQQASWSSPVVVSRGRAGEATSLRLAVAHPFTEPAPPPAEQYTPSEADTFRDPATRKFPVHMASDLDGQEALYAAIVGALERRGGPVSAEVRERVRAIVLQEHPDRLSEAINNHGGLLWGIEDRGQPAALLQVRTEVVHEDDQGMPLPPEMVGRASDTYHLYRQRDSFTGTTTEARAAGSRRFGGTAGAKSDPNPLTEGDGLSGGLRGRRGSGWQEGIDTTRVAIHSSENRHVGHTQSYRIRLRHHVAVERFDRAWYDPRLRHRQEIATVAGVGTFLVTESDALRHGWPVERAAIHRDANGAPRQRPDGTVMTRDDPVYGQVPAGRKAELPPFAGRGGIKGAGMAGVRNLTDAGALQQRVVEELRGRGLLPEVNEIGFPLLARDPLVRASELANLEAVAELSADRLEGDYNGAAQHGVPLRLVRMRPGMPDQHLTLRIRIDQHFEGWELVGYSRAEIVAIRHVGIQKLQRETTEASIWEGGPRARYRNRFDAATAAGSAGGAGQRTTSLGARAGDWVSQGTGFEADAPAVIVRVPHTLRVNEVLADGSERPFVASQPGHADILWPTDLLPPERSGPAAPPAGLTPPEVLHWAELQQLDASEIGARLKNLAQDVRPGSVGYLVLDALTSVHSLLAVPAMLFTSDTTDGVLDPDGVADLATVADRGQVPQRQRTIEIRGEVGESEFLGAANLRTSAVSASTVEASHTVDVESDIELSVQGGGSSSGARIDGSGGRTGTSGEARTKRQRYSRERQRLDTGVKYLYRMRADVHLAVTEEGSQNPAEDVINGVQLVYLLPEWVALDAYAAGYLPVPDHQIEDVRQRYEAGLFSSSTNRSMDHLIARVRERHHQLLAAGSPPVTAATPPAAPGSARSIGMPEEMRAGLGYDIAEPVIGLTIRQEDGTEREVQLSDEVWRLVEQVSDLSSLPPGLRHGLTGMLAGNAWQAKLDEMLGPGGWKPEAYGGVTIRFVATLAGQGEVVGQVDNAGGMREDFAVHESAHAVRKANEYQGDGGLGGGVPDVGGSVDAGGGTRRGHIGTGTVSTQGTSARRVSGFRPGPDAGLPRISVSDRTTAADRLAQRLEIRVEVTGPDGATETVELSGTQVRRPFLPLAEAEGPVDPPAAGATVALPPGPVTLPDFFGVASDRADLLAQELAQLVRERLVGGGVLAEAELAQRADSLRKQLSTVALDAAFAGMYAPGGRPMVTLTLPGGGRDRIVEIHLEVSLSDRRVSRTGFELEVSLQHRSQHTVAAMEQREMTLPVTWFGQARLFGLPLGKAAVGMGAEESMTVLTGGRDESVVRLRGPGAKVTDRAEFRLTVVTKTVRPDGSKMDSQSFVASPVVQYVDLFMFESDVASGQVAGDPAALDLAETALSVPSEPPAGRPAGPARASGYGRVGRRSAGETGPAGETSGDGSR